MMRVLGEGLVERWEDLGLALALGLGVGGGEGVGVWNGRKIGMRSYLRIPFGGSGDLFSARGLTA
jgi:hypothetical protein